MTSLLPPGRLRRALTVPSRRVLAALALVAVLLPATTTLPAEAQSEAQLDELDDQIQDAEGQVDTLDGQVEISVDELNRILEELQVLQGELDARNDELSLAQLVLEDRERILAATTAELATTEVRLAETRAALEAQREAFEERVRQSYIAARPDQTLPLFNMGSAAEFTLATTYLEAIVSRDRAGFEAVDVLRATIEADEAEFARLQAQQDGDREVAEGERNRVAVLVSEQQALVAEVDAAAAQKETVLAGLEADRDSAEALIADLEAESARIEQELAAAAAAAAAAEAAAAAAQAEAAALASAGSSGSSGAPVVASGSAGVVAGSGRFIIPVGGRISSEFGYRVHPISGASRLHAGMDIAAPGGTPIGAAGDGTVLSVGWQGGYGNTVIVDHGGGIATLYAHQSRTAASVGQAVSQGQIIGYVGTTGYSTGNHLHWEVRVNGSPTNPRGYI